MHEPLIVLKFGGSVLADESTLALAVHEIHRWRREGHAVVAVVSALAGVTDALLAASRSRCAHPAPEAVAALVANGELQSAALLGLALDAAGLPGRVLSPAALGLLAEGDPLDATPVALDGRRVRLALCAGEVVVVPGFVGVARDGRTVLLGRGGSDLTALLLAARLGAARCRLVKDVDGLYERDPASPGPPPRRYATARWEDASATDGRIIQRKALRFAEEHGLSFELGGWNGTDPTLIGSARSIRATDAIVPRLAPRSVALLGLGAVGTAVWQRLSELDATFELVAVAVRDADRPRAAAPPRELLTDDVLQAASCGADIIVEALGGIEPARSAIEAALRSGSDVVTANKAVIAAHGEELLALATACGARLLWSAAAGGSTPLLEAVARAAAAAPLLRVEAVLNGTSNFVLDAVASGASWKQALHDARRAGFAEPDGARAGLFRDGGGDGGERDLSGRDAADKLVLLHHAATGRWLTATDVRCTPTTAESVAAASRPGTIVRQVACLTRRRGTWTASVAPRALAPRHALHAVRREGNAARILTRDGATVVRGKGAGGGPTATAILGDLLALVRHDRSGTLLPQPDRGLPGLPHPAPAAQPPPSSSARSAPSTIPLPSRSAACSRC